MTNFKLTAKQMLQLVDLHNAMRAKVRNNYSEEVHKNIPLGLIKVGTLEMYEKELSEILDKVFEQNEEEQ